jgi:hypothetical protein
MEQWTETTSKKLGLPRPFMWGKKDFVSKPFWSVTQKPGFIKVPIPWQSSPKNPRVISLISENEERVYTEGLCAFCGVPFYPDDVTTLWVNYEKKPSKNGSRVFSDHYPFHLQCMRQVRVYCPYMKTTLDNEYVTGTYSELKEVFNKHFKDEILKTGNT